MTRRAFMFLLMVWASAVSLLTQVACNATDIWHQIEAWVPVGIDAVTQIIALLDPLALPGVNAIGVTIKALFADLSAAIDEYLNAPATEKATWAEKVKLILTDIASNFQNLVTVLGTSASPAIKIALALITIVLQAISGFIPKVVPSAAGAIPLTLDAGQHGKLTITPTLMDRKQFIAAFNVVCIENNRPDLRIPRARAKQ